MFDLEELAAGVGTAVVRVKGAERTVHALTVRQLTAIRAALPRPVPPRGKNPGKGSAAPEEDLINDPAFRADEDRWIAQFKAAVVAVALRARPPAGMDDLDPARIGASGSASAAGYLTLSAARVLDAMGERELDRIYERVRALEDPEKLVEGGEKN